MTPYYPFEQEDVNYPRSINNWDNNFWIFAEIAQAILKAIMLLLLAIICVGIILLGALFVVIPLILNVVTPLVEVFFVLGCTMIAGSFYLMNSYLSSGHQTQNVVAEQVPYLMPVAIEYIY